MENKLDAHEKDLLRSYENGEWIEVDNMEEEIERHRMYAEKSFKKNKRVNIRLSERDIHLLKIKAMEMGMPYQTLMASVLHRYVTDEM